MIVVVALLGTLTGGSARAQDVGSGAGTRSSTTTTEPARDSAGPSQPTGQVAYVGSDGRVYVGIGEAKPKEIGAFAAIGANDQAAVSIAPTADVLVYVRSDGALVMVSLEGGAPTVLATDVALSAVGAEPILAWDALGKTVAYIAVGTEAEARELGPQRRKREPGSFLAPMPSGVLGNVIRTVDRSGKLGVTLGEPSLRSMIGVNWSPADPIIVVDSEIPGTDRRYTLSMATAGDKAVSPTVLSLDDPDFAPDGSFAVAVGPAKGRQELIRIALDDLGRKALALDDRICNPVVSPDATRIAYAAGPDCGHIMLISSKGGKAFDVTPLDTPDTALFGVSDLGWTADGRYITYANCQMKARSPECGGPTSFLNPDSGAVLAGPTATTIAPIRRPLVQDVWLDMQMRGPLEFEHSFLISPDTQASLTDTEQGGFLEATLVDKSTTVSFRLTAGTNAFITGTMDVTDSESGIDREFMVLGRAGLLGVRIFSISGIWISTEDLPFATGELNIAIRRR